MKKIFEVSGKGDSISVAAEHLESHEEDRLKELGFIYTPQAACLGVVYEEAKWLLNVISNTECETARALLKVWDSLVDMGLKARVTTAGLRLAQMRQQAAEA